MLSLTRYIMINEGGAAGHMAHPFEYTDFIGNDLLQLVNDLFSGKVETMKEKLDGFNISATMNNDGEVVFIRNKSNLNSEKGGMTVDDMIEKWAEREHQKKVFKLSGEIIESVFKKLGKDYFNPDNETRKIINCECIIAGKTNIMPYAADRVAFHGYYIYKLRDGKWELEEDVEGHVDDLYKAAEGMDSAKPRPNLVIKSVADANKFAERFKAEVKKLFASEELDLSASIEEWKMKRFEKIKPEWLDKDVDKIFNRWFNLDKSFKASELKKLYPDHYDDVKSDKFAKQYIKKVMQPLDNLFLAIGNELISILDGFINSGAHSEVTTELDNDMKEVVELVKKEGSTEIQDEVERNMQRLQTLNNKLNSAEGIVFTFKGRRMKLTGSFACVNQILGARFKLEK